MVVALVVGIFFFGKSHGTEMTATPPSPVGGITQVASPQNAYDIAAGRALQWESDAALMKVNLGDANGGQWTFVFVSRKNKNKGFQVAVSGQTISSASEIVFEGAGAGLPVNAITPDAAMAKARSIPGYSNAAFVDLEMVYNAAAKQWYWGIKTASGATITVKATP